MTSKYTMSSRIIVDVLLYDFEYWGCFGRASIQTIENDIQVHHEFQDHFGCYFINLWVLRILWQSKHPNHRKCHPDYIMSSRITFDVILLDFEYWECSRRASIQNIGIDIQAHHEFYGCNFLCFGCLLSQSIIRVQSLIKCHPCSILLKMRIW